MLSRQEELKERARLLLEQARRDALSKAASKQNTSAATPLCSRQLSDVRNTLGETITYCNHRCLLMFFARLVFHMLCVLWVLGTLIEQ